MDTSSAASWLTWSSTGTIAELSSIPGLRYNPPVIVIGQVVVRERLIGDTRMSLVNRVLAIMARALSCVRGQGLAEYALILALIAILAVVALAFLGGTITSILSTIGKKL
jgi:Flp pilus assembly pilin Flp